MRSLSDLGIPGFETVSVLEDSRGTTVRARESGGEAEVVISLLDRANEPILPKRFNRSRRELMKLTEDNVGLIPLIGSGVASDGRDYVISPYYPIGSLQDQVSHGPTPWYLAAEIMSEVCRIVGIAHEREVVLVDLRPSTIFLEAVGEPVVASFGVATRRFDNGGPTFIAPEAAGDRPQRSSASDVYSLALVLAALIAGRPWARSESKDEFLAEIGAIAPTRILDVIEHGLSTSPTNRYRDGATMRRAIRGAMEADPDEVSIDGVSIDGVSIKGEDEPFDFDAVFEPVGGASTAATPGIPLALNRESLPPGLEDIMFVCRDAEDPEPTTVVAEETLEASFEDNVPTFADGTDPLATGEFHDLGESHNGSHEVSAEADRDLGPEDIELESEDFDLESEDFDLESEDTDRLSPPSDASPTPPQMPSNGGVRTGTTTLVRDVRSAEVLDRHEDVADEQVGELAVAEVDLAEDQTSVLELDKLAETEDQTSVLQLDDLTETAAEDQTSVLSLDELNGTDTEDQTSVLQLDDLTETAAEDQTSVLSLDELNGTDTEDQTSVLSLDELSEANHAEDSAEHEGAGLLGVAGSQATFADDLTDLFNDSDEAVDLPTPDTFVPGQGNVAAYDGMLGPDGTPLEEVPFRGVSPVRQTVGPPTLLGRARTAAELFWFRSRRSVATSAAVFGLLVIVGIVVYFLAQEVRSSTKIEAEGISQTTTTLQTEVTQLATNVPSVTAPPTQVTTTLPPRRPARPQAPAEEDADSQAGDDTGSDGNNKEDKPSAGSEKDDKKGTDESEAQNEADNKPGDSGESLDDEALPPTTEKPDDDGPPATADSGPAGPTTVPPDQEPPDTTNPPKTDPPPTDPPPTEEEIPPADEDDDDDDDEQPKPQRPSLSLNVGRVGQRSATVSLGSDQCVAVRYVLSGSDGSTTRNQSNGYNPAAGCSDAWRFAFNQGNGSGLNPNTSYTLKAWVKALDSNLTSSSEISFSTPG